MGPEDRRGTDRRPHPDVEPSVSVRAGEQDPRAESGGPERREHVGRLHEGVRVALDDVPHRAPGLPDEIMHLQPGDPGRALGRGDPCDLRVRSVVRLEVGPITAPARRSHPPLDQEDTPGFDVIVEAPEGAVPVAPGRQVADGAEEAYDDVETAAEPERSHVGPMEGDTATERAAGDAEHRGADIDALDTEVPSKLGEVSSRAARDVEEGTTGAAEVPAGDLPQPSRVGRVVLPGVDPVVVDREVVVEGGAVHERRNRDGEKALPRGAGAGPRPRVPGPVPAAAPLAPARTVAAVEVLYRPASGWAGHG